MAFVVSNITAIGVECSQALTSSFIQYVKITGTALAADVVLDIGNPTGTFWTSAANVAALNCLQDCLTRTANVISFNVPAIENVKARVGSGATLATLQYKKVVAPNSTLSISQFTGEGATSFVAMLVLELKPNTLPVQASV